MSEEAEHLAVRLIAEGYLPRADELVMKALSDQAFRDELDRRLAACGLIVLDNPYASHIAVAVAPNCAREVFGREDHWISNTLHLSKPDIALLVVLWALLIIPKRERQLAHLDEGGQANLIDTPSAVDEQPKEFVLEQTLVADFQHLWKRRYILNRLTILARHKFIVLHDGKILEGPRLDLVMDYSRMAPRITDAILKNYREISERRRSEFSQESKGQDTDDSRSEQEESDDV